MKDDVDENKEDNEQKNEEMLEEDEDIEMVEENKH